MEMSTGKAEARENELLKTPTLNLKDYQGNNLINKGKK
jgi:hypothetical protein